MKNYKSHFFALYYGQKVYNDGEGEYLFWLDKDFIHYPSTGFLALKDVKNITPEEQGFITSSNLCNNTTLVAKGKIGNYFKGDVFITDYLRSQGYALPYLDLTVGEMIEMGWIKLQVC